MNGLVTILKSKFFKKSREKRIEKLEEELGWRNSTDVKEHLHHIEFLDFVFAGLALCFIGVVVCACGMAYTIFSFIWNNGGIFDKIMIVFFGIGAMVIITGGIYSILKSDLLS